MYILVIFKLIIEETYKDSPKNTQEKTLNNCDIRIQLFSSHGQKVK